MKKRDFILVSIALLLISGCGSKESINYYLPLASTQKSAQSTSVSVETASYMSGDRIWYKQGDVFLPYKNSYFAKTQREFATEELDASLLLEGVSSVDVVITDSYQSYNGSDSEYVLNAKVTVFQNAKRMQKNINIKKQGFGKGPKEASKGFEAAVKELALKINEEFKIVRNK